MSAAPASATAPAATPAVGSDAMVQLLSLQMVREYLSNRGYKKTLAMLHTELPSQPPRTSRTEIVKNGGLTPVIAYSKKRTATATATATAGGAKPAPALATLLEMTVDYFQSRQSSGISPSESPSPTAAGATAAAAAAAAATRTTIAPAAVATVPAAIAKPITAASTPAPAAVAVQPSTTPASVATAPAAAAPRPGGPLLVVSKPKATVTVITGNSSGTTVVGARKSVVALRSTPGASDDDASDASDSAPAAVSGGLGASKPAATGSGMMDSRYALPAAGAGGSSTASTSTVGGLAPLKSKTALRPLSGGLTGSQPAVSAPAAAAATSTSTSGSATTPKSSSIGAGTSAPAAKSSTASSSSLAPLTKPAPAPAPVKSKEDADGEDGEDGDDLDEVERLLMGGAPKPKAAKPKSSAKSSATAAAPAPAASKPVTAAVTNSFATNDAAKPTASSSASSARSTSASGAANTPSSVVASKSGSSASAASSAPSAPARKPVSTSDDIDIGDLDDDDDDDHAISKSSARSTSSTSRSSSGGGVGRGGKPSRGGIVDLEIDEDDIEASEDEGDLDRPVRHNKATTSKAKNTAQSSAKQQQNTTSSAAASAASSGGDESGGSQWFSKSNAFDKGSKSNRSTASSTTTTTSSMSSVDSAASKSNDRKSAATNDDASAPPAKTFVPVPAPVLPSGQKAGVPISLDDALSLRRLCFGKLAGERALGCFNEAWMEQGFFYIPSDELKVASLGFGLVQPIGGPCGIIAVVQAYILKDLLFSDSSAIATKDRLAPTPDVQRRALVNALTELLWQTASERKVCRIALKSDKKVSNARTATYTPDGITEQLVVYDCTSQDATRQFISANLAAWQNTQPGAILFMYSVLLTRGLNSVRLDRDEADATMVGAHNYATQEMVNLALTGAAHSNVFDGNKMMDKQSLRGIQKRSTIGFFTLFEKHGYVEVGSHYKSPLLPIWIINSESHYSVLFALDRGVTTLTSGKFDVYYYDELAHQTEEIRLTIHTADQNAPKPKSNNAYDESVDAPIEDCIKTKWKGAVIDWNGVDRLL